MTRLALALLLGMSIGPALAAGTIIATYEREPRFPATEQHPAATRHGPFSVAGRSVWVDAIGGTPTAGEVATLLEPPKNVIPFAVFIGRWTDPEYALLMQRRATAVQSGSVSLVKQWDQVLARGAVDLNAPAVTAFKAALVSAAILTQARADAIFN